MHQIEKANDLLASSNESLSLIIDGKALTYALDIDVKDFSLELAISCSTVICCRSTPKQKALVSKLFLFPYVGLFSFAFDGLF